MHRNFKNLYREKLTECWQAWYSYTSIVTIYQKTNSCKLVSILHTYLIRTPVHSASENQDIFYAAHVVVGVLVDTIVAM